MDLSPGRTGVNYRTTPLASPDCDWLSLSVQGSTLGAVCVYCTYTTLMGLFLLEQVVMQRLTIFNIPCGLCEVISAGIDFRDG